MQPCGVCAFFISLNCCQRRSRDRNGIEGDMTGHDVELSTPWYETRILNCSFCGKMIAARYWCDDAFPDDKFCELACADVKRRLQAASQ
jgi:hypothetical protein